MEKIIERNMLFDFYGDLLTDRQRSIYQDAVYEDLSLSELAESYGISRQGVHDQIKRCNKTLEEYEQKLHLVERFQNIKEYSEALLSEVKSSENEKLYFVTKDYIDKIKEQL